jgi:hypothetical protein
VLDSRYFYWRYLLSTLIGGYDGTVFLDLFGLDADPQAYLINKEFF